MDCTPSEEKGPTRPLSLTLPPPSPLHRTTNVPLGPGTPLWEILSPRSLSDTSPTVDDQRTKCRELERLVSQSLEHLLSQYKQLQRKLNAEDQEELNHLKSKRKSTEDLLRTIH